MRTFKFSALAGLLIGLSQLFSSFSAYGQTNTISLRIERYSAAGAKIDIRPYIKVMEDHFGLRLKGIEVIGSALNQDAEVFVRVNAEENITRLLFGSSLERYVWAVEPNVYIGYGAENIELQTLQPAYVKIINLVLSDR